MPHSGSSLPRFSKVAAFPRGNVFGGVSDTVMERLGAISKRRTLEAGQILFSQGDIGHTLFAVADGTLEVSVLSPKGKKLALDVLQKDAVFGEIALFDPGPRTATVTALDNAALWSVQREDLMREIRAVPDLGIELMAVAARRMRQLNQQLQHQAFLKMPERLARTLLHLTSKLPETAQELELSQAELSDFSGASREAVSRTLADWKQGGIVAINRNRIRILDRHAMRVLSGTEVV